MAGGLDVLEGLLDVAAGAVDAAGEGGCVAVAFEEGGGFGGVEGVFGTFAGAVDDGGVGVGEFLGELAGALPVHVAVDEVVELAGGGGVVDRVGECVGDVLDVGDFS